MLAKLHTFSLLGIDALPVEVEVDLSASAFPKVLLVGLPEAAVKESMHRIERALVNSGYVRPEDRVVINLAPADLPKQAASFDLPMSLGLLAASGQLASDLLDQYAVVGELALDGSTRPIKGALSMAIAAAEKGLRGIVVPKPNAAEAAVVERLEVISAESLTQAAGFFTQDLPLKPMPSQVGKLYEKLGQYEEDYSDVRGQEMAKRALTLAAAGGHNLLMVGPPGSGKTMLAKRIPTILPQLLVEESIETTRIYSAMGQLRADHPLMVRRPFRAPHHTTSNAGLVGGGSIPTPGDITMAHHGVLFLDELPEFNRRTLEVLRQPLEDGHVTISRALQSTTFPADFMLIAALNPCPCGYRNDVRRECHCSVPQVERYMSKISGPLLDRIDLHIEVPALSYKELNQMSSRASNGSENNRNNGRDGSNNSEECAFMAGSDGMAGSDCIAGTDCMEGTDSHSMLRQVKTARARQARRFAGTPINTNAHMSGRLIRQICKLSPACSNLLEVTINELGLSARAHDKVLRIARTIADVDGAGMNGDDGNSETDCEIQLAHIQEAVNYRMLDRQFWS